MGAATSTSHLEMQYLRDSPSAKTKVWLVHNTTLDESLGVIRWHGAWRKYTFVVDGPMLIDATCARQIAEFLDEAMRDYQEGRE